MKDRLPIVLVSLFLLWSGLSLPAYFYAPAENQSKTTDRFLHKSVAFDKGIVPTKLVIPVQGENVCLRNHKIFNRNPGLEQAVTTVQISTRFYLLFKVLRQ